MTKKTKPVFLIMASVLLFFVAVIFVFLLTQAYSANTSLPETSTVDQTKPRYKNEYASEEKTQSTEVTQSKSEEHQAFDNVIRAKKLSADKKGKVYDANDNEYTVTDDNVAVVHAGNFYLIPVEYIQQVSPAKEKTSSSKKAETKDEDKEPSNSAADERSSNLTNTDTNNSGGSVIISQSQNVSRNESNEEQPPANVKMNYKALGVNKGSLFSLVLTGADGSVNWSIDSDLAKVYQKNGNQCSFTAIKKGTVQITATYKGYDYFCTVTIN